MLKAHGLSLDAVSIQNLKRVLPGRVDWYQKLVTIAINIFSLILRIQGNADLLSLERIVSQIFTCIWDTKIKSPFT